MNHNGFGSKISRILKYLRTYDFRRQRARVNNENTSRANEDQEFDFQ